MHTTQPLIFAFLGRVGEGGGVDGGVPWWHGYGRLVGAGGGGGWEQSAIIIKGYVPLMLS